MNNYHRIIGCLLILVLVLQACSGKYGKETKAASAKEAQSISVANNADTLRLDLHSSEVLWKGTKMRGVGKHEGSINIASGFLLRKKALLIGGSLTIDMRSLTVTDIPAHEPVPRQNLNNHLKSEDFFAVERYPAAVFTITEVNNYRADSLMISGNLMIKDSTKNITIQARDSSGYYLTRFQINRFDWNIAYEGNWADRTFVDPEITFNIKLATQ